MPEGRTNVAYKTSLLLNEVKNYKLTNYRYMIHYAYVLIDMLPLNNSLFQQKY